MTRSYRWQGYRFEVPTDARDDTVVTLVGRSYTLTVSIDPIGADANRFATYVDTQLAGLKRIFTGWKVESKKNATVSGMPALEVETTATADGRKIRQLQAYVRDGERVLIVTATADDGTHDEARKAFQDMLQKLARE